jgi:hypothetical protein
MRAHVGRTGCLVPWDRIESAVFRILTTCVCADELHGLAQFENHRSYAKTLEQFYSERVNDELSELLLFVAVSMRVRNDAGARALLSESRATVGFLNTPKSPSSEDLNLKDALDKIIHARSMLFTPGRFDNPHPEPVWMGKLGRIDGIRDFVILQGEHHRKAWGGRLDLLPFCAEIIRIADGQPRHRQKALLSPPPRPAIRTPKAPSR